jgi:SAM-dependent methyltransferase
MSYLAAFYDFYNLPQKNQTVTEAENVLIQTICQPPASILDVGCGTGRHLIPLQQMGYQMYGLDSNADMLASLNQKAVNIPIMEQSITNADCIGEIQAANWPMQFDLIISMWNAFNEYALDIYSATAALQNMRELLTDKGRILLNVADANLIKPTELNYTRKVQLGELKAELTSTLLSFDAQSNITSCREVLKVNQNGQIKSYTGELVQRWWKLAQLQQLCHQLSLQIEHTHQLPVNQELYIEISKLELA